MKPKSELMPKAFQLHGGGKNSQGEEKKFEKKRKRVEKKNVAFSVETQPEQTIRVDAQGRGGLR